MDKIFNWISIMFGLIGGVMSYWLGGIPGSSGLHNGSHQRYLYEKAVIGNRVQGITEKDCNVYCDCSVFFHSGIDWKYNSVKRSCDYVLYLQ